MRRPEIPAPEDRRRGRRAVAIRADDDRQHIDAEIARQRERDARVDRVRLDLAQVELVRVAVVHQEIRAADEHAAEGEAEQIVGESMHRQRYRPTRSTASFTLLK